MQRQNSYLLILSVVYGNFSAFAIPDKIIRTQSCPI
jgi:hypothetical protein